MDAPVTARLRPACARPTGGRRGDDGRLGLRRMVVVLLVGVRPAGLSGLW